jgi:hypothetical protein
MGPHMMFCQGCGAKNADEARFCNMCGGRIAVAGEPGGPMDAAPADGSAPPTPSPAQDAWDQAESPSDASGARHGAVPTGPMPPMGASTTGITLARIGVQSSGKVWSVLALVAVGLVALGALSTWLVTQGDGSDPDGGHAKEGDPFVIGTPLPQGAETPDEEFLAKKPGGGEASEPQAAAPSGRSPVRSTQRAGAAPSKAGGGAASGQSSAPAEDPTPSPSKGAPPDAPEPASEGPPSESKGAPAERDIGMDLYGARVRYAVQRYYAPRAQGCFDRATRNHPTLSGTVVVGLRIGADGRVTEGSVVRNTTGDAELGACLAGQVRGWQLPPPPEGAVDMEMPFSR